MYPMGMGRTGRLDSGSNSELLPKLALDSDQKSKARKELAEAMEDHDSSLFLNVPALCAPAMVFLFQTLHPGQEQ